MGHSVFRKFVFAAAAGLVASTLAGGLSTAANAADDKTVWKFNIWGGPRAFTSGIQSIKETLEEVGGGKFELSISYGDALGPRKQNPHNIRKGAFAAGQMCVGYYPGNFPLLGAMELPFLLPGDLRARAAVEMAVMNHPLIVEELGKRWNMVFFGPAFLPPYEFMGNTRISSTADMKGVKMRISGMNARALQAFGAVPTMVTAPEGYTALSRGTIDSFGFPYSYAFGAYKLYEVSKYVTEGIAMSGFMCFQAVNKDVWNKTPKAVRDAMPRAQEIAIDTMIGAYTTADAKWIPIFHKKLEVVKFPADERKKLAAGAGAIWASWVKEQEAKGRPAAEMLAFIKSEVAKNAPDS